MTQTLVCIIGQARAHSLTWNSFEKYVLSELNADLAICIDNDSNFSFDNPFYRAAKYRWFNPSYQFGQYDKAFDAVQSYYGYSGAWRQLHDLHGTMLGGIHPQKTVAAILYFNRWVLLQNIRSQGLLNHYDRFVVTRSDFVYTCPHPRLKLLDPDYIWIPEGEDYGGFCDRHIVLSGSDIENGLNLLEPILKSPEELYSLFCNQKDWNIEKYMKWHFRLHHIESRVKRMPYSMYLVRTASDSSTWNLGAFSEEAGAIVKYKYEFENARVFGRLIHSSVDWDRFFGYRNAACSIFLDAVANGIKKIGDPAVLTGIAIDIGYVPLWSDLRHELAGENERPTESLSAAIALALSPLTVDEQWYRSRNSEIAHLSPPDLNHHWRFGGYFEGRYPRESWGNIGLANHLLSRQV